MLRIAVAGAGMVSLHHLRAWQATSNAKVVAIADPDLARAQGRASEFGIEAAYGDAGKMLDAQRPDALDIAAGHAAHQPLCIAAAERGIAILCQKPLAPSLAEARVIAAFVGSRSRMMIHENWRFRPWYRQAQEWVDCGAIGAPLDLQLGTQSSGFLLRNGKRPALERQPMLASVERLMIGEVLVHHLDVGTSMIGPLTVATASIRRGFGHLSGDVRGHLRGDMREDIRGETAASIELVGDGTRATIAGDLALEGASLPLTDYMSLAGSSGAIVLERNSLTLQGRECEAITLDLEAGYQASYDAAIAHFAEALLQDRPFATTPEAHLRVLALAEDAYRLAGVLPGQGIA